MQILHWELIDIFRRGHSSYSGVWNVDNLLWRFGSSKAGSVANIRSEKVGIGTDSPAYKLDVSGTGRFTGNVIAPTFVGALSGNASSATYASAVTLTADNSSNATRYPLFVDAATGNLSPRTDTGFTYNPSTGTLTATSFVGNLTGLASLNLPLTGGTITGSSYNMLELKRSTAAGSSILFSNSNGNLGKFGFSSDGILNLGTGSSMDGQGDLMRIHGFTKATEFYGTVTAPTFIGNLTGLASLNLPLTGGTMTGILKAQNNTSYTTKQVRNIILSPNPVDASAMGNGDIWITYE